MGHGYNPSMGHAAWFLVCGGRDNVDFFGLVPDSSVAFRSCSLSKLG